MRELKKWCDACLTVHEGLGYVEVGSGEVLNHCIIEALAH
jgi:hypothetical protein